MAKNSNERRAELKNQLKQKIDALAELNSQIDSIKMTASYQDWYKKYSFIKNEIENVKNSKEMNMDSYQRLMRELRNIKKEKPVELAQLQEKKSKLQVEAIEIQAELKGKRITKEGAETKEQAESDEKNVGMVDALRQLAELQVACSKIQTAQRRKAVVELISTITEVVDVKLTEASKRFKNAKSQIKEAEEEFKATTTKLTQNFDELILRFEEKKQNLEQKYISILAQIHKADVDIGFWKKRVSGKHFDKKAYVQWNAMRKKIDTAMKKLESLKTMSKEQMAEYSKLAKQKAQLDKRPEFANNPLVKMILERESLVEQSMTIESDMVQLEQQRTEARTEFIQQFAEATEAKENKLAVVDKPGIFGRVVATIADKFNAKKRFNEEVRTPMQHFISKLGNVSKGLQDRIDTYVRELNGKEREIEHEKSASRISDIIENGRKSKQSIISRLQSIISKDNDRAQSRAKEKPALEAGMEL